MYKTILRIFLIFLSAYLLILLGSMGIYVFFTDLKIELNVFETFLYKSLFFAMPIGLIFLVGIEKKWGIFNFNKEK